MSIPNQILLQVHETFFHNKPSAESILLFKTIVDATFVTTQSNPILIIWPSPPYTHSAILKAQNDLQFQLKWQCKIFDILLSLPNAIASEMVLPSPPYTPEAMQQFVQQQKEREINQELAEPKGFSLRRRPIR